MNLINIILDERKHAEQILSEGIVDRHPRKTINALAKYYQGNDYTVKDTEHLIDEFLTRHMKKYNHALWYRDINKIVNRCKTSIKNRIEAGKEPLICVDHITITDTELNTIRNLKSVRLEKLAFSLLVYAKIGNLISERDTYWVNDNNLKDVYIDSQVKVGKLEQAELIHKLIQLGYIKKANKADSISVQVLFGESHGEEVIRISKFDGFIYEYLRWTGENVHSCNNCSRLYVRKSNRQLRCLTCRKTIRHKDNT